MNIKNEKPPIWDVLVQAGYAVEDDKVIFTWGDTLYNPYGVNLTASLLAHEAVHTEQQRAVGGPEIWWDRWINEPAFRAEQEAQAYGKQYHHYCGLDKNRENRNKYLNGVVGALTTAGLYKLTIKTADARAAILKRAG